MNTRAAPVVAVAATPVECLLAWGARRPHQAALLGVDGQVSYGELASKVRAAATWLAAQGVQAGDTVALSLEDTPTLRVDQIALCWGVALLGAALLPLYPGVASSRAQMLMQHFGVRWWLASQAEPAPTLDNMNPKRIDIGGFEGAGDRDAGFGRVGRPEAAGSFSPDPTSAFLYDYTSGTTGTPRLVLHSHAVYLAAVVAHGSTQRWQVGDVFLPPTLWPGKVGLRGVFRALCLGLSVVTEPFPETLAGLGELIDDLDVNCVAASPAQLRQLMTRPPAASGATPVATFPQGQRLRVINVTGAYFAPEEVCQGRLHISPQLRFTYGAAETGVIASLAPEDPPDGKFSLMPGVQVQALDAHGQPLGPGLEGRLRIRAPWACNAYARNPEASALSFKDGWFYSTDTGFLDADGRLCLQGRADDAINLGGIKIYPRDVEAALLAHPEVQDAAVIAYPEPTVGEIPVAFVQFRRNLTKDTMPALRAWLTERLYQWQMPRGLVVMQTLPRTADGKLITEQLRETYRKMEQR